MILTDVIKGPLITEKLDRAREKFRQYSFIVDRQARIQHLDGGGKFLNEWHTPESLQGKPVGLTVGPDGNLWVPDTHYHRVLVYAPNGKLVLQFGSNGTGPGQFTGSWICIRRSP